MEKIILVGFRLEVSTAGAAKHIVGATVLYLLIVATREEWDERQS